MDTNTADNEQPETKETAQQQALREQNARASKYRVTSEDYDTRNAGGNC